MNGQRQSAGSRKRLHSSNAVRSTNRSPHSDDNDNDDVASQRALTVSVCCTALN